MNFNTVILLAQTSIDKRSLCIPSDNFFIKPLILAEVKIGIYRIQNFHNIVSNRIIMADSIYHLESKRVENSVFFQEIGGENGIFSKKRRSGGFGIFSNSTV